MTEPCCTGNTPPCVVVPGCIVGGGSVEGEGEGHLVDLGKISGAAAHMHAV